MKTIKTDFLVVGSGIAGLSAARTLSQYGETVVLTKGAIKEGATQYAQGGIAVALHKEDTPQFHLVDTLKAGVDLCDPDAVRVLVEDGPERVRELIGLGAKFDRSDTDFHFTQEAAHQRRRILHAGDATGREIEKTLGRTLLAEGKVRFLQHTTVCRLLTQSGQVVGCDGLSGGETLRCLAKATLLATGGYGQLYAYNTNPPVATGDGVMLAYDVGAAVVDLEFVQFHPTTLYLGDKKPISIFLITEAVRGEGAVLRDRDGNRFMTAFHPDAELAPRDVVSRGIMTTLKQTRSTHVYLDLSGIKGDVRSRFPTIYKRCLESKIDIEKDFIPVAPAAHYCMGGVQTNLVGQTHVPGLYAIGEVSSLGLHGANRLASNSLLDGLVFGHRAAEDAASQRGSRPIPEDRFELPDFLPLSHKMRVRLRSVRQQLRDLMWEHCGISRDQAGLETVLDFGKANQWVTDLQEFDTESLETRHMMKLSHLVAQAALIRQESRGAHFRSDFPKTSSNWQRRIGFMADQETEIRVGLDGNIDGLRFPGNQVVEQNH